MIKNKGIGVCVDLLETALSNLKEYACKYQVEKVINPVLAAVENYQIAKDKYDFIFSVSRIEHVPNKEILEDVIKRIVNGTKLNGSNCLMMQNNREKSFETDCICLVAKRIYNSSEVM